MVSQHQSSIDVGRKKKFVFNFYFHVLAIFFAEHIVSHFTLQPSV